MDTLFGALVVRQSAKKDPHNELYDEDDNFVLISEVPRPDISGGNVVLLINGQVGLIHLQQSKSSGIFTYALTFRKN